MRAAVAGLLEGLEFREGSSHQADHQRNRHRSQSMTSGLTDSSAHERQPPHHVGKARQLPDFDTWGSATEILSHNAT
jgi:hypothetical protein